MNPMAKIQLLAGRSHPQLAREIARLAKIKLTPVEAKNFADGEIYFRIKEKIRGDDVFILQTLCSPVNENLMELLIAIDACRRASAGRINVVCPFLAYSRQDRKATSREPITAKLVANLITAAGADRLLTVDLHADQIQGFYDIPVDHFVGSPQFANYFKEKHLSDLVVVSPDIGGVRRSRELARLLNAPLVIVDKRRRHPDQAEILRLIGEVKGKNAIVVDDMIDTAGTVSQVAEILVENGAKEVFLCATHGLFSGEAISRLQNCPAREILLLDTVPLPPAKKIAKIKSLSLAPLLAEVILRIHQEKSLGELFSWEKNNEG